MDWSKSKNILIAALIVTNMILIGVLVTKDKVSDPTITPEFMENVRNKLKDDGIMVKAEIPDKKSNLKPLIVEYEDLNINNLYKNIYGFEFKGTQENISLEEEIDGEYISIKKGKHFYYENKNKEIKYDITSKDEAIEIAEDFIENLSFNSDDICMSYIRKSETGYIIKYSKEFEENYVEKAYMNIEIDKRGVKSFERLWLNVLDEGDSIISINSAPKSLLSLLGRKDLDGKKIVGINLVHYFDPEEHDYAEIPKDPRKGKTIPAWRIQFEDGKVIIIDNYR